MKLVPALRRTGAIIPLLLLALTFSACRQTQEAKGLKYLEAGKKLLEKHDLTRAVLQFRNAARALPDNAEVYYQMGLAYLASQDASTAYLAFRKALELDPKHLGAQVKTAQVLAATNDKGSLQEAQQRLRELLKTTAATPEVLNTLAFSEIRLGNMESGIQLLYRVLAESPQELESSAMLASAKLWDNDPKGAEEVLLKACAEAPKSADARRILGELFINQKKFSEAEGEFRKALEIDPKNGRALMDLGKLQVTMGQKQEAERIFGRLSAINGYKPVHAIFLFQEGRTDEAVHEFEKLAKDNPENRSFRTNLVVAYRILHRMADADRVLKDALTENPKDVDALEQRGEVLLGSGKYDEAEADLNQVLQFKPDEPEIHYLLAKVNQARGTVLTYRQELYEALRIKSTLLAVRLELAHSLLTGNSEARAALDLLGAAPETQRDSTPILIERNWAFWALGNLAEMRKGIDRGLARERSVDLLIQDGVWKLRAGDPAHARASIEEALKINPQDVRALAALSQTYVVEKGTTNLAMQKVKEYAVRQPKSAPVQDFLGMMLMAQGDRVEARAAFTAAKTVDSRFVKADLALVQIDVLESKFEDARKRLDAVLAADDNNNTARLWIGNIEEILGHHNAALDHFRKAVEVNPGNAQASNNLAYMLTEYGNQPDEALKYAEKAVLLAPTQPAYSDTMGWILYRKGLYSQAIGYLERASSDHTDAIWKYHLAMAYAKAGDVNRGRTTLEAALKINPRLPEAKLAREMLRQAK